MATENWMQRFLEKFRELLKIKAADGDLSSDDLDQAMRQARAHVGGMASGEKKKADKSAAEATKMNEWRLLSQLTLAEDGKTGQVQIFPAVGTYNHPRYGKLNITPEFLKRVKANFDAKVYQQELPLTIDLEHQSSLSGAAGWIDAVEIKGDSGMWAKVGFNERGKSLVDADSYRYFSPEFYDVWQDPATSKQYDNVLIGGALTNRPFFKGMAPVALMAEGALAFVEAAEDEDNVPVADMSVLNALTEGERFAEKGDEMMGMMADIMAKMKAMMQKMGKGEMPEDSDMEMMSEMMDKMQKQMPMDKERAKASARASEGASGGGLVDGEPNQTGGKPMGMSEEEAKQFAEMGASLKTLREELVTEREARHAAETAAKAASERVSAIERADRRRQFAEFVRDNRHAFEGEVETCVDRLEKLSAKLDEGELNEYLAERKALASRVKASDAFVQISRPGPGNGTAASEFEAAKRKLMAERNIDEAEAVAAVAASDPALYNRFDREFKHRIKRGEE